MSANIASQPMYTYATPTTYGSPTAVQHPYGGGASYVSAPQVYMVAGQTAQYAQPAYSAMPVQYVQQPVSTVYGAPPVTYAAAPVAYQTVDVQQPEAYGSSGQVTYVTGAAQPQVTYVQPQSYMQPQTYAAPAVYQAPVGYATSASVTNLASVPSMVAVPQYQFYTDHSVADQVIANINQIGGYGAQTASEMPTAVGVPQLTPTPPPAEPAVAKKSTKSTKAAAGSKSVGTKKKKSGCC